MDRVAGFFKTIEGQAVAGIAAIVVALIVPGAIPESLVSEFRGAAVALLVAVSQRVVKKLASGDTPFQPVKPSGS